MDYWGFKDLGLKKLKLKVDYFTFLRILPPLGFGQRGYSLSSLVKELLLDGLGVNFRLKGLEKFIGLRAKLGLDKFVGKPRDYLIG